MARVAPLLSSSSLLFVLSPIVLTLLVASWPTPALVEAKSLQAADDEPQWIQTIHDPSSLDDKVPFQVRVRRSPQGEADPDQPNQKPGFLSSFWTSIKNFTSVVMRTIGTFWTHIFGGESSTPPDNDNMEPPKPHDGGKSSPSPRDHSGGSSENFNDNTTISSPSREYWDTVPTAPGNNGKESPPSSVSHENASVATPVFSTSPDYGNGSSPVSNNHGRPSTGDGSASENNHADGSSPVPIVNGSPSTGDGSASEDIHGDGSSPIPGDDDETTPTPFDLPDEESAENEISNY